LNSKAIPFPITPTQLTVFTIVLALVANISPILISILFPFADGVEKIDKVMENQLLFSSCMLGSDGYYITFNDSIDVPSWLLYEKGQLVPLTYEDFLSFTKNNIVDTSDSCMILECSRQNLAYMVKQEQLTPLKEDVKGNLYLKKDVLKLRW